MGDLNTKTEYYKDSVFIRLDAYAKYFLPLCKRGININAFFMPRTARAFSNTPNDARAESLG